MAASATSPESSALSAAKCRTQGQAAQDAEDAKARKENLVALGNAKNCFAAAATPVATPAKAKKK